MKWPTSGAKRFQLVLIKPSHYDDDGYVIRWWRGIIPSNSLAAVYGIAADCAERQVLGPDVAIDIEAIDETTTRIDIDALLARFRKHGGFGLVAPRRRPVERVPARARHRPAVPRGRRARGHGRLPRLRLPLDARRPRRRARCLPRARRRDVRRRGGGPSRCGAAGCGCGRLAPVYNYIDDLPGIEGTPVPFLPKQYVSRTLGLSTSFDAGRGCPYQCSFCTIINVQGRKSRYRSADDVEALVRLNWAQGISKFFITDDNFARNREWESIYDRLIELREVHGIPLGLMIQVDTLCHRIPELRRESEARRSHPGLHRPRERQSRQSRRRQEAPEQDHRVPQDAACVEGAGHHHAGRLHPRLSRPTRRRASAATSPSSRRSCRSMSSSSSA